MLCLIVDEIVIAPHALGQPAEWQTAYYSILALGLALVLAALLELGLGGLEAKLDELLAKDRKSTTNPSRGCPRGHMWPVDGCPFCRRDSAYL
jgi:hypothetical protein